MTQTELEQLSRDVAKKRGNISYPQYENRLYKDSAFCFELMVSEKIDVDFSEIDGLVGTFEPKSRVWFDALYAEHNNDANQATRVAILKAYLAKGE